jgi:hypothetical protein
MDRNSFGPYGSIVGIVTGYSLDDIGAAVRVLIGQGFSLLQIVQTVSGVHPNFYPEVTWGSFPGVKRRGREADHSPPASTEVKKMWIYTSIPPYAFLL